MKIPAVQPITAVQSRASRFQLGLTQAQVIEQSGLAGYKLKQFETGRFVPDMPFLQKLADFYSEKGIDLTEVQEPSDGAKPAAPVQAPKKPGSDMVRHIQRPCFYISDSVTPDLLDKCLERMHHNDELINVLMKKPARPALMGGYKEETEKEVQQLFGALAEGYLIFRLLQGNPLVQPVEGPTDAKTLADLVSQFFAASPFVTGADPEQDVIEEDEEEEGEEVKL
jgi:transcriptional regulator with XRE-family HTH domain